MEFEKTMFIYDFEGILELAEKDPYIERNLIDEWNRIVEEGYYRVEEDLLNTILFLSFNCSELYEYCVDINAEEHELHANLFDFWSGDSKTRKKYLEMLNEIFIDMYYHDRWLSYTKHINVSLIELLEPYFDKEKQSFLDSDLEYIASEIPTKLVKKVVLKEKERLNNLEAARKEYTRLHYRFYENGTIYHDVEDLREIGVIVTKKRPKRPISKLTRRLI